MGRKSKPLIQPLAATADEAVGHGQHDRGNEDGATGGGAHYASDQLVTSRLSSRIADHS